MSRGQLKLDNGHMVATKLISNLNFETLDTLADWNFTLIKAFLIKQKS